MHLTCLTSVVCALPALTWWLVPALCVCALCVYVCALCVLFTVFTALIKPEKDC